MRKFIVQTCQCTFALLLLINYCIAQKIDCDKKVDVAWQDEVIRTKTYQYIRLANDPKYKVSTDTLRELAVAYIDVQSKFNATFDAMKREKNILTSKKKICIRYSDSLDSYLQQATEYNNRILKAMGRKTANFGVDDALKIVDWIWTKLSTKTTWYDDLVWADWDAILKGNTAPAGSKDKNKDSSTKKSGR